MSAFDGMCAIVTGSASELGAATAIAFAREGARVIINYASSAREAEATADLCRSAGATVKVVQANIADDGDCRRLAAAASEWDRLDILVNNAGTTKHVPNPADLDALSAEDFHWKYQSITADFNGYSNCVPNRMAASFHFAPASERDFGNPD
jgi:3-oxoacyl-[acyl-carrier protein] reductase